MNALVVQNTPLSIPLTIGSRSPDAAGHSNRSLGVAAKLKPSKKMMQIYGVTPGSLPSPAVVRIPIKK